MKHIASKQAIGDSFCDIVMDLLFYLFGPPAQLVESKFPNQGLNPCPLQWKPGVLTTGPPGKSPETFRDSRAVCQNIVSA